MRFVLAALVVAALAHTAEAQEPRLPVITSPLAPIGLPLPAPGPSGRDPWIMGPHRDPWIMTPPPPAIVPPKFADDHRRRRQDVAPVVVYVPQYVTVVQTVQTPPSVILNVVTPAAAAAPARRSEPPPPSTPPEIPAAKPSTFYFIPGCYMGNIPPEQMKLPAGCDLSRLVTRSAQ